MFKNMSEEEIYAYNEGLPVLDQIYCIRQASLSSRIRKRHCKTIQEWTDHNASVMSTIDVLGTNGSYTGFSNIGEGRR